MALTDLRRRTLLDHSCLPTRQDASQWWFEQVSYAFPDPPKTRATDPYLLCRQEKDMAIHKRLAVDAREQLRTPCHPGSEFDLGSIARQREQRPRLFPTFANRELDLDVPLGLVVRGESKMKRGAGAASTFTLAPRNFTLPAKEHARHYGLCSGG